MTFRALQEVVQSIASLPGIGERSAMRIVLHLLKQDPVFTQQLAQSLTDFRDQIQFCDECGALSSDAICDICSNPNRDRSLICVVEEAADVLAIERSGVLNGLYHVLMGVLSPLDGIGPSDLRLSELLERIHDLEIKEICIATNPTIEGDATAGWLLDQIHKHFQNRQIRITRIAHGIATGGNIEFADSSTLAHSIQSRSDMGQANSS